MNGDKQKTYLFDNPRNVRRVVHALAAVCVIIGPIRSDKPNKMALAEDDDMFE